MNSSNLNGPVVAEVDGSEGGLRAVELACAEALRAGVAVVLASPYAVSTTSTVVAHGSDLPSHVMSAGLRTAVDTARHFGVSDLRLTVVTGEGPPSKVLPAITRQARLLLLAGRRVVAPAGSWQLKPT